jgi:hypothetical protein
MLVESSERSTGMGATHYIAVLDGEWIPVSQHPNASYLGRDHGEEEYDVEVPDDTIFAYFYRSNRGNESVTIKNGKDKGKEFNSFERARRWGEQIFKEQSESTI